MRTIALHPDEIDILAALIVDAASQLRLRLRARDFGGLSETEARRSVAATIAKLARLLDALQT